MPTSPPFSPPLKSAERNPQKGAADDVGAEDQHPDQQSRFHVSGPSGGARSAADERLAKRSSMVEPSYRVVAIQPVPVQP
jgi:hypothetical protein